MTCPHCGHQNHVPTTVCLSCGKQIAELRPPKPAGVLKDDKAMRMILPVGRSGLAIAAGYAGLFGLLIFPAPLALLLGIAALVDLHRNPDKHGKGRAIFGLIIGIIGSLLLVAILVK